MKGETVKGTWARRGCGPGQADQSGGGGGAEEDLRFESYIMCS